MSSEFFIKRGNRLPVVQAELADAYGVINLSGAAVEFIYRAKPSGILNIKNATIVSGDAGIVQYAWTSGDVNTAGVYWCEWRTTFSDGKQMSFPNDSYITFEIIKDLAS